MKELIEYYYNLEVANLNSEKDKYYFDSKNNIYFLVPFYKDKLNLKDIIECTNELHAKNIYCHELMLNNNNEVVTIFGEQKYILLKILTDNKELSIIDILDFQKKTILKNLNYQNNWNILWQEKLDYIESMLSSKKFNSIIENSIDYYIGLGENAIIYLNYIEQNYNISSLDHIVLSHYRVVNPCMTLNFYNPLSFVFDLDVRDIAEYLKDSFFKEEDALFELKNYLSIAKLSNYSLNMLFARLLYPTYYFDFFYEEIDSINSEKILKIINKQNDYEDFLKKAYNEISLYAKLDKIDWFKY